MNRQTSFEGTSFEGKNIFVCGGAGFIGRHLCKTLLERNATVVVIDNFSSGTWKNIEEFKFNPNFSAFYYDICNPEIIKDFSLLGIDVIVNLATLASPKFFEKNSLEIVKSLTLGSFNLLEMARRNNAIYLLGSSSEIYGNPDGDVFPVNENYNGNVNPLSLRACYSEGKRVAETIAMIYHRKYNVDVRIARIHNTYGSYMRDDDGRVIPNFLNAIKWEQNLMIYGDGKQTRSFLYIDDLIDALIRILSANHISGEAFNIGSTDEISIYELAQMMIKMSDSKSNIRSLPAIPNDPRRRLPNIKKAKKYLGWCPTVSLKEGLRELMEVI